MVQDIVASGSRRFANYCIDAAVYLLLLFALMVISSFTYPELRFYVTPFYVVALFTLPGMAWFSGLWLLYYFVAETIWQRTPGKVITGTMVVNIKGGKPSFFGLLARTLTRAMPLGLVFFDERVLAKTLHDRASGTCVVDTNKYKEAKLIHISIDEIGTFAE